MNRSPRFQHKQRGVTLVALVFLLLVIGMFALAFYYSSKGWGYVGYYGYHQPYSSFYWGSPRTHYQSPSIRNGSINGSRHVGGGPGRGK